MKATSKPKRSTSSRRLWFLIAFHVILFALLTQRLVVLQVFQGSYFEAVAASQRQRASELLPHRGTIYVPSIQTGGLPMSCLVK
jgi:cell division protein FtsI/penicillin-binding protein 2